jgi:hypothetical protein
MARHIQVKVCKFSELSEKAKDRAKQEYATLFGYAWSEEALESLKELTKHFGGRIKDYNIDYFESSHSSAEFDMPDMEEDEIKELLDELGDYNPETLKGNGDCKLTGYCADEDAIDGFRRAFHEGERNLEALMDAAFDSWLKACQSDCEAFYSDEDFGEHCEANDYEFYEDGTMV